MLPKNCDIVFPNDNEQALLIAYKLGFKDIIFCYDKLPKPRIEGIKIAILISEQKDVNKYRNKADFLIGLAKRELFEDKRIDAIMGLGLEKRKDHTHYRRSLTQVEAELAKKQDKTILFSLHDLMTSKRPEEVLGRWLQDMRVLKKKSADMRVVSGAHKSFDLRSRKDLENFLRVK